MAVYKLQANRLDPQDRMIVPAKGVVSRNIHRPHRNYYPVVFGFIFGTVWLAHFPFLKLPYFWDEAGYFIPAAHDIYTSGKFIPFSTLSNAHPPLVMTYLALAWKLFGFHHVVTRTAMLLVSSVALLGLFRLAERVANVQVAVATVVCTALYPVFFAQSSLAHLDMMVTALTMWALVFYLPVQRSTVRTQTPPQTGDAARPHTARKRRWICIALLSLAGLTKETAVLIPVGLCGWELFCALVRRNPLMSEVLGIDRDQSGVFHSLALLLALLPLAGWFAYHHAQTGYTFGNPEYVRYNVGATLNTQRVFGAFTRRISQVTRHMNLWALTLIGFLALFYRPKRPLNPVCPGIVTPVLMVFAILILTHVGALSLVGGAVLARYMLPVSPLLVLLWVSVIWRCTRFWMLGIALVCVAFAFRCEINPSASFTWEDNLAYRDFILLHVDAARFLAKHEPTARVLTAWPATNELTTPLLGYVDRPVPVVPLEDFKRPTLERAMLRRSSFDAALIYSTPAGLPFDDLKRLLGGRVVYSEQRKGQWIAVLTKSATPAVR